MFFTTFRNPYKRLVSAYKDKAINNNGEYCKQFHNPCSWYTPESKSILTFSEFVNCIITKATNSNTTLSSRAAGISLDHHWAPQALLSLPCSTNYTMIGRHENFNDDVRAAKNILHLNGTVTHENETPKSQSQTLDYWYKQLDTNTIDKLVELYSLDFSLFGYDKTLPTTRNS